MKIGMTLPRADHDAPLAEHFGKAKWLLVVEASDRCELVRNEGLDGRSVAAAFVARGCTDVIATHLGAGAYAHLTAAGIRTWQGDAAGSVRALARSLEEGGLRRFLPENVERGHAHHGHAQRGAHRTSH